jgi:hypothetical protein
MVWGAAESISVSEAASGGEVWATNSDSRGMIFNAVRKELPYAVNPVPSCGCTSVASLGGRSLHSTSFTLPVSEMEATSLVGERTRRVASDCRLTGLPLAVARFRHSYLQRCTASLSPSMRLPKTHGQTPGDILHRRLFRWDKDVRIERFTWKKPSALNADAISSESP